MNIKYYNIHDVVALEWHDPCLSVVPDFAVKYHYFLTGSMDDLAACPARLRVIHGLPPLDLRRSVRPSAERFGVGDGVIAVSHQHGRMRWRSWILGLGSDSITVWYEFRVRNRLQWPWTFFPDHLICFHVVEPLIESLLQRQNVAVLHAGAVARDGKAILLSGRGGTRKTSHIMALLRQGWQYLADDLVLMRGDHLLPYPLCDSFFDYFYRYREDENLGMGAMIGAFRHVRRRLPLAFPVAPESRVTAVNLLLGRRVDGATIEYEGVVDDEMLDRIVAVDRLERLTYVDYEEAMGRFLLQLDQVFGTDDWESYWHRHRELLAAGLTGLPARRLAAGRQSTPQDLCGV